MFLSIFCIIIAPVMWFGVVVCYFSRTLFLFIEGERLTTLQMSDQKNRWTKISTFNGILCCHFLLSQFVSCCHRSFPSVTIHFLLSPFISCCHRSFPAVTVYFLLSPFISCCHRLFPAVTVHFLLSPFISFTLNLFSVITVCFSVLLFNLLIKNKMWLIVMVH